MNDEYEGLTIQESQKLVQDKMSRTGMVSRLIEFGISPILTRWAFMKDGRPTLDCGIAYMKFIYKKAAGKMPPFRVAYESCRM